MPSLSHIPPQRFGGIVMSPALGTDLRHTTNSHGGRKRCSSFTTAAGAVLPWPLDGLARKIESEWKRERSSQALPHVKDDRPAPCASGRDQATTPVTGGEKVPPIPQERAQGKLSTTQCLRIDVSDDSDDAVDEDGAPLHMLTTPPPTPQYLGFFEKQRAKAVAAKVEPITGLMIREEDVLADVDSLLIWDSVGWDVEIDTPREFDSTASGSPMMTRRTRLEQSDFGHDVFTDR